MINMAVVSYGTGGFQIQCVLDAVFFNELENTELSAVIVSRKNSRAYERALHAGAPAFIVDRELFPNEASFTLAILNKLADLDIDLLVMPGAGSKIAPSLACAFSGKIIATRHSLYPAFLDLSEEESMEKSLEMGVKLSGSTVFMPDKEGNVGKILYQKAVPVLEGDSAETLLRRILDEAESEILLRAIKDYGETSASEKAVDAAKETEEETEENPEEKSEEPKDEDNA